MTIFRRIMLSVFFLLMLLVPFAQSSAQPGYYHRRHYYRRHYYHRPYYRHRYYRRRYYHHRY